MASHNLMDTSMEVTPPPPHPLQYFWMRPSGSPHVTLVLLLYLILGSEIGFLWPAEQCVDMLVCFTSSLRVSEFWMSGLYLVVVHMVSSRY